MPAHMLCVASHMPGAAEVQQRYTSQLGYTQLAIHVLFVHSLYELGAEPQVGISPLVHGLIIQRIYVMPTPSNVMQKAYEGRQ